MGAKPMRKVVLIVVGLGLSMNRFSGTPFA
jgi:hypothetical protein